MNRHEAEQLVGTRVEGWTSSNGIYSGVLTKVISGNGRPWRGVVLIDSVFQLAQHFENGSVCRRGYRPGEEIEVGGVNISTTDKFGFPTYVAALEEGITRFKSYFDKDPTSRHSWASIGMHHACVATLAAEKHREATGEWDRGIANREWVKLRMKKGEQQ